MKDRTVSDTLTKQDRKAARDGRAPAPGLLASGERRATQGAQRHRSWGLVTVAALSVLGTGLAVAAWGLHAGQKESVLAIGEPVAKGQVIAREDLVTTSVSGVSGAIPVSEINNVVNQTATVRRSRE